MNSFNLAQYREQMNAFPSISYQEFQGIDDLSLRKEIVSRNKILQTDAYNRTMTYLREGGNQKEETFTLTFRRSPNKSYNIVYGIRQVVKHVLGRRITQDELDFAKAAYEDQKARGGTGYFDANMWQDVIDNHNGYLPLEVRAVQDGTVLRPQEPVMSVTGPRELAAVFEPQYLRVFFQSVVATDIHFLENIIGSGRVIEMGKRAAPNEYLHLDAAEAVYVWGGVNITSNDAAAVVIPQIRAAGTTAHRYFASYKTEEEGFENAIEKSENITLLVDLVDSYRGIDKIVALKEQYRHTNKTIYMRLDSGDLIHQAVYALEQQKAAGMLDPKRDKIVIADIENVARIEEIETKVRAAGFEPKDFIVYGLGWLLVIREKLRDMLSAAYKLTQTEEGPTGKLSNDIGKEAIPGRPNLEIRADGRYIVQQDEEVRGERLLKTVYRNGETFFEEVSDIKAIDQARETITRTEPLLALPTIKSDLTEKYAKDVRTRFRAQVMNEILAAA